MKAIFNIHLIHQIRRNSVLISLLIFLLHSDANAQVAVIGAGGATSALGSNAGPIFRSSAASTFDFSNHYYLYTSSELAAAGITVGSTITAIAWNKGNALGTAATNTSSILQVHMKNSSVSPSASWCSSSYATQSGGATLVYNNTAQLIPLSSGYILLTLSTPFVYSGGSLEIGTNWNCSAHVGNPTTGGFTWMQDALSNQVFGGSNSSASVAMSLQSSRPQILFSHSVNTSNTTTIPCTCDTYTWACNGITYTQSGTYTCTSINSSGGVHTEILIITIASCNSSQVTACDSYTWPCNGQIYNASGTYTCTCFTLPTVCSAGATAIGCTSGDEYISNVVIGSLNNSSSCPASVQYQNFTALYTIVNTGGGTNTDGSYPISITCMNFFSGDQLTIWVDWNNDGIFGGVSGVNETTNMPYLSGTFGPNVLTGSIAVPSGVVGARRMRIRLNYVGVMDPCGVTPFGEVEDYTLLVNTSSPCLSSTILDLTIHPNPTLTATITQPTCTQDGIINYNIAGFTSVLQCPYIPSTPYPPSCFAYLPTASPPIYITSFPAGTYVLTGTDANGCTSSLTANLVPPPTPVLIVSTQQGSPNGSFIINATGGSMYNFSIYGPTGNNPATTLFIPTAGPVTTTATYIPGYYTITACIQGGCCVSKVVILDSNYTCSCN